MLRPNSGGTTDILFALSLWLRAFYFYGQQRRIARCCPVRRNKMSFICVDFFGARKMADEIAVMGEDCAAIAAESGLNELEKLAADLAGIAADIRRAADEKEREDNDTLFELRPDYGEVLK